MLTAPQARLLGADAFSFGFPLLTMKAAMRLATNVSGPSEGRAPLNSFAHLRDFSGPGFAAIVGANSDTLYSLAWFDLSAEPLVLELPDTDGRSYLVPLVDAWTNVFVCLGPRTAGTFGGTYALTGPGWEGTLPNGVQRIVAPTNTVTLTSHIHASGNGDLEHVRAIQAGLTVSPLSGFGAPYTAPAGPVDDALDAGPSPHRLVMAMAAATFLSELAREMGSDVAAAGDARILDRLAEIGLRPGQAFDWDGLPAEIGEALSAGLKDGKSAVLAAPEPLLGSGWREFRPAGDRSGTGYLRRAQMANVALGVPHPEDAAFPLTDLDSEDCQLNGENDYTLRFGPGGLPPVGALWSLALYDMDQLFVENELDRYALGDRDPLEFGSDDSVEIAIEHERPDGSTANWLPSPQGDFNLMLHMYWPNQQVVDGGWTTPSVQRGG